MITVDATLDTSGMASGECILPEVCASGSTVREPFLISAAHKFGEALVSTLAHTRKSFANGDADIKSSASACKKYHASRSLQYAVSELPASLIGTRELCAGQC
jgi:hypothetical protein